MNNSDTSSTLSSGDYEMTMVAHKAHSTALPTSIKLPLTTSIQLPSYHMWSYLDHYYYSPCGQDGSGSTMEVVELKKAVDSGMSLTGHCTINNLKLPASLTLTPILLYIVPFSADVIQSIRIFTTQQPQKTSSMYDSLLLYACICVYYAVFSFKILVILPLMH